MHKQKNSSVNIFKVNFINKAILKVIFTQFDLVLSNNLTFKTLSLGFYIISSDTWMKTFKKYSHDSLNNHNLQIKYYYFASLIKDYWFIQQENHIKSYVDQIVNFGSRQNNDKKQLSLLKIIKLGSFIVNVEEIQANQHNNNIKYRVINIAKEFYHLLFTIWLIFSIKVSFNSNLFSYTVYQRYFDVVFDERKRKLMKEYGQFEQNQVKFQIILKNFKDLCDLEWKKLMKDYMIALNDDKEIIKHLMKNISKKIQKQFHKQIDNKKINFCCK